MKEIDVRYTNQTPIYQQLYDQISSQIISGVLKPDELLPSIRTAAKELRVSIITIKKTWEMLEASGLIYTIAGKGTYVKNHSSLHLEKKKIELISQALKDVLVLSKSYQVSKDELMRMMINLYDEMHETK